MFSDSLIPLNTDPSSPKLEDVYEKFINSHHRMDIISGDQDKNEVNDDYVKTLCLSEKPTLGHENFAGTHLSALHFICNFFFLYIF